MVNACLLANVFGLDYRLIHGGKKMQKMIEMALIDPLLAAVEYILVLGIFGNRQPNSPIWQLCS